MPVCPFAKVASQLCWWPTESGDWNDRSSAEWLNLLVGESSLRHARHMIPRTTAEPAVVKPAPRGESEYARRLDLLPRPRQPFEDRLPFANAGPDVFWEEPAAAWVAPAEDSSSS